ncbi:MAG: Dolichol monophosphate mannose synthase [Proteobacteria bacterium]|nr:Dolichol monophosphate mannose synthase [Pseudomonadota bacterium]
MSLKLSVVIPTFREVRNLEAVARSIEVALRDQRWAYEVIFVDDNSQDGSEALAVQLADKLPVRMIVRHGEKGLSTAVLRGISEARGEFVVVMDAYLSLPAERIPDMLVLVEHNIQDFVVRVFRLPARRHAGGAPALTDWLQDRPGAAGERRLQKTR